jgi:septal ring factor EnvC (AmiA/AmiB activator)
MRFIRHAGHGQPASMRNISCRSLLGALGMSIMLALPAAHAAKVTERSKQKRAAEAERAELRQKLTALKRDITQTESAKNHAADELGQSEKAISDANRALHELVGEQQDTEARLKQLAEEQERLSREVARQQAQLSKLLREQYVAGNEDRIKLLLSGDNPNRINRDLQYMGYVSQAEAKLIDALRANLRKIEADRAATQNARDELEEIAEEQREQKTALEQEKAKHSALLAKLSTKLAAQRKEAGNVERNEQRLGDLVGKLSKLIEEQRKAELAAQEKRRQAALASKKTTSKEKSRTAKANPDAIDDDEPPKSALRNELEPVAGVQDGGRAFAALRGQLRLPVKGELVARFGSKRGDGPSWKGLFIRAPEGSQVKAVAAGKVVFAEWLRGFGNLVIIDHGGDYMTIYGNNEAVLKQAGDVVKTGDAIASAGNSGGNEQSGLYFEMRHQGRAFDPMSWVITR